jgi:hypothetical protein
VRGRKEKTALPDACERGDEKHMALTGNISGLLGKTGNEPSGKRAGKNGKTEEDSLPWCVRVFSIFLPPSGKDIPEMRKP